MYDNKWLTNNGPLLQEFSARLAGYLGVPFLVPTSSGTAALQLAYHLFGIKGNIVTTPYSFVATCNSADWVGLDINFADIDPNTLNISPVLIENAIDVHTSAIVPVHAYGNPCDINAIRKVAFKHKLTLIYDAAHAFGVTVNDKSVLLEGDASAISLHATKLFHCIEGGALILKNADHYERAMNIINFGINVKSDNISRPGFNGKMSEAHAAMGLAMLDDIDKIISRRLSHYYLYKSLLTSYVEYPTWNEDANQCAAYFPILLRDEIQRNEIYNNLAKHGIQSRPYFSPSLNTIEHFAKRGTTSCPVSELVASKVLCLPLFYSLKEKQIRKICSVLIGSLQRNNMSKEKTMLPSVFVKKNDALI